MGVIQHSVMSLANASGRRARAVLNKPTCNIVVACMPKSGSTYLTHLLSQCIGYHDALLNDNVGGQQELSRHRIRRNVGIRPGSVSHIHLRANAHNLKLIKRYGLKPIVLTRNLFDVIPSIADHFRRESVEGVLNYVPDCWAEMDDEALHDFVIYNCLPWYLGFLFSWQDAAKQVDTSWITYEQLFDDQVQSVKQILGFVGVTPPDDAAIQQAVDGMQGKQTRLNKGVRGRGEQLLLPRQQEAVRQLAKSWGGAAALLQKVGVEMP